MAGTQKAIISWGVGKRNTESPMDFLHELRSRVIGQPEISTDGFHPYRPAIRDAFGANASHGVIVKTYWSAASLTGFFDSSQVFICRARVQPQVNSPHKSHTSCSADAVAPDRTQSAEDRSAAPAIPSAAKAMPSPGGSQAEPTIGKAVTGGYDLLEARCNR